MLPVLLDLGFIKIYTYGVFLLLSFFWAAYFLWKNILLTSYKEEDIFDSVFISLFGGLMFGRIEFVVMHFSEYSWDLLKFFLLNGYPGIGYLGFLLGFFLTFAIMLKRQDIPVAKVIDCVVPPLLLAIGIGKLGAFFSGTEIGTQTTFPISLIYQNIDGLRHLTPLYEATFYFMGSYFSFLILRSIRRDLLSDGFNGSFFIFIVSLTILLFDNLKSFRVFLAFAPISFDFMISAILLLTIVGYYIYYFRKQINKISTEFWAKLKVKKTKD